MNTQYLKKISLCICLALAYVKLLISGSIYKIDKLIKQASLYIKGIFYLNNCKNVKEEERNIHIVYAMNKSLLIIS